MIAAEVVFSIIIFTLSVISVGSLAGSRLLAFRRHMKNLVADLTDNDDESIKLFDDRVDQGLAVYGELKWQ
jgi:dsDNA-specific endonuclease/ATPase MutS2